MKTPRQVLENILNDCIDEAGIGRYVMIHPKMEPRDKRRTVEYCLFSNLISVRQSMDVSDQEHEELVEDNVEIYSTNSQFGGGTRLEEFFKSRGVSSFSYSGDWKFHEVGRLATRNIPKITNSSLCSSENSVIQIVQGMYRGEFAIDRYLRSIGLLKKESVLNLADKRDFVSDSYSGSYFVLEGAGLSVEMYKDYYKGPHLHCSVRYQCSSSDSHWTTEKVMELLREEKEDRKKAIQVLTAIEKHQNELIELFQ